MAAAAVAAAPSSLPKNTKLAFSAGTGTLHQKNAPKSICFRGVYFIQAGIFGLI
jgi:hypothetical protein